MPGERCRSSRGDPYRETGPLRAVAHSLRRPAPRGADDCGDVHVHLRKARAVRDVGRQTEGLRRGGIRLLAETEVQIHPDRVGPGSSPARTGPADPRLGGRSGDSRAGRPRSGTSPRTCAHLPCRRSRSIERHGDSPSSSRKASSYNSMASSNRPCRSRQSAHLGGLRLEASELVSLSPLLHLP